MVYRLEKKSLKLKVNWKISRNESIEKNNFFLHGENFVSEIAPNIRYGENEEIIRSNFLEFEKDPTSIKPHWSQSFKNAVVNLQLKEKFNGDLSNALGVKFLESMETSFSFPIMALEKVEKYLNQNSGYPFYKIKIDHENGISFLQEISKHTDKPLRVDANEAFHNLKDYFEFEKKLEPFNIQFIEQPFPAKFVDMYKDLKPISKYEIIADESVLDKYHSDFKDQFHGVNVKLMKAGGLLNAKEILVKAKADGLKTMVGCMIESSLGIKEAAYLAELCDYLDLDGSLLLDNDPYKDLLTFKDGKIYF